MEKNELKYITVNVLSSSYDCVLSIKINNGKWSKKKEQIERKREKASGGLQRKFYDTSLSLPFCYRLTFTMTH